MKTVFHVVALTILGSPIGAQVPESPPSPASGIETVGAAATPETSLRMPALTGGVADTLQELRLGDGTKHIGRVLELHPDRLVFETVAGLRIEAQTTFARLRPARGRLVNNEFWAEDLNATRLFFAPTGRPLGTGEGYAGLFVFLPFVAVGATNTLSLAGGLPPAGSLEQVPIWVAPKLNVYRSSTAAVSTGLFALYIPGEETWDYSGRPTRGDSEFLGIIYGVGTFGDADRALHAGAGLPFGTADTGGHIPLMVGGELRVSRRNKLITENWLITGVGGMISGGVRIMGNGRWTTDLGLAALPGEEELPYFPIVSFSYGFGGGR